MEESFSSASRRDRIVRDVRTAVPKAHLVQVLRRTGYSEELIREISDQLADPIDLDRDGPTLLRYGATRERLSEIMGASP